MVDLRRYTPTAGMIRAALGEPASEIDLHRARLRGLIDDQGKATPQMRTLLGVIRRRRAR